MVTPIQVAEQADSKPDFSNVFELHLPGRNIANDLSKAWRKKINTVIKEICFAMVVRNAIGLQRILFRKYQQM